VITKLTKVNKEVKLATTSPAKAQSTGVPVNLLWEKGVVKVQPAIVPIMLDVLFT